MRLSDLALPEVGTASTLQILAATNFGGGGGGRGGRRKIGGRDRHASSHL